MKRGHLPTTKQLPLGETQDRPVPHGTHTGCCVDPDGFHRATVLRDHATAPEIVGPKFKTPREAIDYSDELEKHGIQ